MMLLKIMLYDATAFANAPPRDCKCPSERCCLPLTDGLAHVMFLFGSLIAMLQGVGLLFQMPNMEYGEGSP